MVSTESIVFLQNNSLGLYEAFVDDYIKEKCDFYLGAYEEETACGLIGLSIEEDALFIQYLFVANEYRNKGHGTRLVDNAKLVTEDFEVKTLKAYMLDSEMGELYRFLLKRGFDFGDYCVPVCRIRMCDLKKRKSYNLGGTSFSNGLQMKEISEIPKNLWRSYVDANRNRVFLDLEYYDPSSLVVINSTQNIIAGLLFKRYDGTVSVEYIFNDNKDDLMIVLRLIYHLLALEENGNFGEIDDIVFQALSSEIMEFASKLCTEMTELGDTIELICTVD